MMRSPADDSSGIVTITAALFTTGEWDVFSRAVRLSEPSDEASEAGLDVGLGLIAELDLGLGDIGIGAIHVARLERQVFPYGLFAEGVLQFCNEVVDADRL
jgi:hypothetical protein